MEHKNLTSAKSASETRAIKKARAKFIYHLLSRVYNISYTDYIKTIAENPDPKGVLDLGCGSGNLIRSISEMFPALNCVGVDLIQEDSITNNLTLLRANLVDYVKREDLSNFGLIIMNDVIEHFAHEDIRDILTIIAAKMRPRAVLCM